MASLLRVIRGVDAVPDTRPEWIGVWIARLGLLEVECTWTVSGSSSEGIAQRCGTGAHHRSVREPKVVVTKINELV